MTLSIRPFAPADTASVLALWALCDLIRPWNDPHKDIARKLAEQPDLFLVGCLNEPIVATAMAGYDGHRGWVYYLAVHPQQQRLSLGRQMMTHVEHLLLQRGCPKVNLMVRSSNAAVIAFYRQLGYSVDEAVPLGKRLIPDQ